MQTATDNLKRLHSNLTNKWEGFNVPYEQFVTDMQDTTKLRRLHNNLTEKWEGFNVPYDQFSSDMFGRPESQQPEVSDFDKFHGRGNPSDTLRPTINPDSVMYQDTNQPQEGEFDPMAFENQSPLQQLGQGWTAGVQNLKGGLKYLGGVVGETLDNLDGEDEMQWDNRLMESARKNFEAAPQGKGIWYELGSFAPQMIGIAAASVTAPITAGGSLAAVPAIIGGANIAMLVGSASGMAMNEYDEYKDSKGEEGSDLARIGVGVASGAAEYLAERIGLDRYMPKGSMSKAFSRFLSKNEDVAEKLAGEAIKKNPSIAKDFVKRTVKNMAEEGTEESLTEAGNILIETVYKDKEDYETFEGVVERIGAAFRGGAMMGGALSPITYTADRAYKQKMHFEADGSKFIAVSRDKEGNIIADELADNFVPTGQQRIFKQGEDVKVTPAADGPPLPPGQPTDSPQVPTINKRDTFIADRERHFQDNMHESGDLVTVNVEGYGSVPVLVGAVENGKFIEPDGTIFILDNEGNTVGIQAREVIGEPVVKTKDEYMADMLSGFDAEVQRRELANQAAFDIEGRKYVDTGQKDEKGNMIAVPLDQNSQPIEAEAIPITPELQEQITQAKETQQQVEQKAQEQGVPQIEVKKATWGKNEYQYTKNEDGTSDVLIPNKVKPEAALKEIQKHFENNPKFEAVPVTESREIPAPDDFSDPTTQEVMTGIKIVPKQIATPVPSQDNKKTEKAEPKYLFGKETITPEEAAEMINLAETPQELEGLRIDNDPNLQQLLLSKFPEKTPKYTISGQQANPTTVKAMIRMGKNLDQITIENDSELQTLYDKKVKELTKAVNIPAQNVKKVPEVQAETPVLSDNLPQNEGEMLQKGETGVQGTLPETGTLETTKEKRERIKAERAARGEKTELNEIPETPQKYTVNVADLSLPLAPTIPLESINWEASNVDKENIGAAKLVEIRGRNSDGILTGTVRLTTKDGLSDNFEVFFNDKKPQADQQQQTTPEQELQKKVTDTKQRHKNRLNELTNQLGEKLQSAPVWDKKKSVNTWKSQILNDPNISTEDKQAATEFANTITKIQTAHNKQVKAIKGVNAKEKKPRGIGETREKANEIEATSPYEHALKYFIGGGSVTRESLASLIGGSGEINARILYVRGEEKGGKTIDAIAHELWEANQDFYPDIPSQDYRDAVNQVILGFNSPYKMAESLLNTYGQEVDPADLQEGELDGIAQGIVENSPQPEAENTVKELLDKFIVENNIQNDWFTEEDLLSHVENLKTNLSDQDYNAIKTYLENEISRGYDPEIAAIFGTDEQGDYGAEIEAIQDQPDQGTVKEIQAEQPGQPTYEQIKIAVLNKFGGLYQNVVESNPNYIYENVPEATPELAKQIYDDIKAEFEAEKKKESESRFGWEQPEVTPEFDFSQLYGQNEETGTPIDQTKIEREEAYQKSGFDKKWAGTYEEAVTKVVAEYKKAQETKEDWATRVYKSNDSKVDVGKDEYDQGQTTIGAANERRRKQNIQSAEATMNQALQDLKELGLSKAEIDGLIGQAPTPESNQTPELSLEPPKPGKQSKTTPVQEEAPAEQTQLQVYRRMQREYDQLQKNFKSAENKHQQLKNKLENSPEFGNKGQADIFGNVAGSDALTFENDQATARETVRKAKAEVDRLREEVNKAAKELSRQKDKAQNQQGLTFDTPLEQKITEAKETQQIRKEEKKVNTEPTEAQKEAGNYQKGHVKAQGFDISIEQPKGSTRTGTDSNGKQWSVTMNNTYGYFKRTKGRDGDQIDVFLGSNPESGKIFVVDQNVNGKFDEHKVMMGFQSEQDARESYLKNYEEGWQGLGAINEVSREDLKAWLKDGTRTKRPFAESKEVPQEVKTPETKVATSEERLTPNVDTSEGKQPWEMTRENFVGEGYTFSQTDRALKMELNKWQKIKNEAAGENVSIEAVEKAISNVQRKIDRSNEHRESVQQAISEGKIDSHPDYPELSKANKADESAVNTNTPERIPVIGIGDLHGENPADLKSDMVEAGIIDTNGKWKTKNTVVQIGDVTDRGKYSNELIDFLDEVQAGSNGNLVRVLGNHDLFHVMGQAPRIGATPDQNLTDKLKALVEQDKIVAAWSEGDVIYTHAGIDLNAFPEFKGMAVDKIVANLNERLKNAVTSNNYNDPIFNDNGIFWTRGNIENDQFRQVVGHTVQKEGVKHKPGQRVTYIDTGRIFGGDRKFFENTMVTPLENKVNEVVEGRKEEPGKEFEYNLRSRPFSIGTYPPDNFVRFEEDGSTFGKVIYSKQVPLETVKQFELVPIGLVEAGDYTLTLGNSKVPVKVTVEKSKKGYDVVNVSNEEKRYSRSYSVLDFLDNIENGTFEKVKPEQPESKPKFLDEAAKVETKLPIEQKLEDIFKGKQAEPKDIQLKNTTTPETPIEDFGEKILGAKKDIYSKINNQLEATQDDVLTQGFAKVFPLLDYAKMVEAGAVTPEEAALLHYMREKIGVKPQKRYKINTWLSNIEAYKNVLRWLTNKEDFKAKHDGKDFMELIEKSLSTYAVREIKDYIKLLTGVGFPENNVRLGDYKIMTSYPGEISTARKDENGRVVKDENGYVIYDKNTKPVYSITKLSNIVKNFESYEQAVEGLKYILTSTKEAPNQTKFDIYYNRNNPDNIIIGKKVGKNYIALVEGFNNSKEAQQYVKENQEGLEKLLEDKKTIPYERPESSREREGLDRRNGKDATPQMFAEAFQFRGVQFGNWVEQGKRQEDLNRAYDALMDLADIIGVPPAALSLNGELGLAFGARGSGGKQSPAAHYEPTEIVINLTKKAGAGSLAHEWFHAVDNYFSRMRGMKNEFLTEKPYSMINKDGTKDQKVRNEVIEAIKEITNVIRKSGLAARSKDLDTKRTKDYWSQMLEMSARSFESYVLSKLQEKGISNDYLVSFLDIASYSALQGGESYPYPTFEEAKVINPAFEKLFNTLQTKEEGGRTVLFRKVSETGFYSTVESALESIKQERGTPEQFKAMLLKNGAKQAEMDWMGFDEFAAGKKGLTKAEVQQWINQNRIEVKEVVKGEERENPIIKKLNDRGIRVVQDPNENVFYWMSNGFELSAEEKFKNIDLISDLASTRVPDTKYSKYQLPGGSNYKEMLLTMPMSKTPMSFEEYLDLTDMEGNGREGYNEYLQEFNSGRENAGSGTFKSSHWDEVNPLAHIRIKDYTDTEGRKILLVEEVQSDWAQEGRKKGFNPRTKKAWEAFSVSDPTNVKGFDTEQQAKEYAFNNDGWDYAKSNDGYMSGVPSMPFPKTDQWVNLALRRVMRYAAENGYDGIAWTPGEIQAGRYDLSKQVDKITVTPSQEWDVSRNPDYFKNIKVDMPTETLRLSVNKEGRVIQGGTHYYGKNIDDIFGKEIAEKILNSEGNTVLSGNDLKIGGTGMKGFYDQIIPAQAAKVAKPFNSKVQTTTLDLNENVNLDTEVDASIPSDGMLDVQFIPVTSEMVTSVMQGVPLFKQIMGSELVKKQNTKKEIRDRLNEVQAQAKNARRLIVYETIEELQSELDASGMNQYHKERALASAKKDDASAFYMTDSKAVFINIANVNNVDEAVSMWIHEMGIHAGLRNVIPTDVFDSTMESVYDFVEAEAIKEDANKDLQDNERIYRAIFDQSTTGIYKELDKSEKGEEMLAYMGEKLNQEGRIRKVDQPFWDRVVQIVLDMFKKLFSGNKIILSKQDITNIIKASIYSNYAQGETIRDKVDRGDLERTEPEGILRADGKTVYSLNKSPFLEERLSSGDYMPDKLTINGVERHTRNSNGQLIHPTRRGIENFYKWFGESKVTDAEGRPMVVYHGSKLKFDTFDISNFGKSDAGNIGKGFYFSPNYAVASGYSGHDSKNIMEVYLNIRNPADVMELSGADIAMIGAESVSDAKTIISNSIKEHKEYYKEGQHPEVLEYLEGELTKINEESFIELNKIYDGKMNGENPSISGEIVALRPNQIKSATGNDGGFNPDDNRILFRKTPIEDAAEKISNIKKDKRSLSEVADGIREYLQEKDLPISKWQKDILNKGGKITDKIDAFKLKKKAPGRLQYLVDIYLDNFINPVLDVTSRIQEAGIAETWIVPYIVAKHTPERNRTIRADRLKEWKNRDFNLDNWIAENDPTQIEIDEKIEEQVAEGNYPSEEEIEAKTEELQKMDFSGILPMDKDGKYKDRPDELANDIVENFESEVDPKLVAELWEKIGNTTNHVLDAQVKSNVVSEKQAAIYRARWEYYIPLRGWWDDAAKTFNYISTPGKGVSMKHAEGRGSMAEHPLAYLINIGHQAISEQVDSEVKNAMLNTIVRNYSPEFKGLHEVKRAYFYKDGVDPDTGEEFWRISNQRPTKEQLDNGDAKIEMYGEHFKLRKPAHGVEHEVLVRSPYGNYVVVFPNNPEIAHAFNNQNFMYRTLFGGDKADSRKENAFAETKIRFPGLGFMSLRDFTNVMKAMFTQYNIKFVVSNFPRDFAEANIDSYIIDKDPFGVAYNTKRAIVAVDKHIRGKEVKGEIGKHLNDFYSLGGTTGHTHNQTPEEYVEYINKRIKELTSKGNYNIAKRKLKDWLTRWNQRFEDGIRFSVYLNAISNGHSPAEAAYRSRNATVDFNIRGKGSPWLGTIWGFFEVAANSFAKNGAYFTNKKTYKRALGVATTFAVLGFFEAMLNDWADDDDEEKDYYNRSEWMRHNYLNIPTGGKEYVTLALPQYWRGFKAFGAAIYDYSIGQKGKIGEGRLIGTIGLNFIAGMSPIDIGSAFAGDKFRPLSPFIPTALRPFYELSINRDFIDRQITKVPFTEQQKKDLAKSGLHQEDVNYAIKFFTDTWFRFGGGDNETMVYTDKAGEQKRVNPFFDINPSQVEHIVKGYTGGTYTFFSDIINTGYQMASKEEDFDFRNAPFVNAFIRKTPERKWKVIRQWYDYKAGIHDFNVARNVYKKGAYKGDKEAKDKYVTTMQNNFNQEYNRMVNGYSKVIDLLSEQADYSDPKGLDDVVREMERAIGEIDKLKSKYNKK